MTILFPYNLNFKNSTNKYLSNNIHFNLITMVSELWLSLTMKTIAFGHSLHDAQQMAAVILIERLLIYTLMGYRLPAAEPERSPAYVPEPVRPVPEVWKTFVGLSLQRSRDGMLPFYPVGL